jgi:hypothetical protein
MSPLRRTRAGLPGGVPPAATRLVASALVLVATLLLARASAVATTRDPASDVCVPPVPVGGSCTSTSSTSSTTRTTTQSTSTVSTSTTGTQTETTTTSTSTGSTETSAGTGTSTAVSNSTSRPGSSASPSPASRLPAPPPPLPPPSPGSAPVSPDQAVQRIVMVPAVSGPIAPGDTVEVQAILEAQRGTEIYAVPHVPVTFAIVSGPGYGGEVTPARVSSGDTGVAVTRVRTGDRAGDTVVSATSGAASAQLTLHTDLSAAGASARVSPPATSGGSDPGGHHVALLGALAALGILGALTLGLVRRRPAA